jgi:hypothetical protein
MTAFRYVIYHNIEVGQALSGKRKSERGAVLQDSITSAQAFATTD